MFYEDMIEVIYLFLRVVFVYNLEFSIVYRIDYLSTLHIPYVWGLTATGAADMNTHITCGGHVVI